jgi:hypothetical protein
MSTRPALDPENETCNHMTGLDQARVQPAIMTL